MNVSPGIGVLVIGLLISLGPLSAAAELYRYKNEDGITVLDSHVPARYVKNGYTILSLDGRVLEVVPRALTEEEIRRLRRVGSGSARRPAGRPPATRRAKGATRSN